MSDEARKADLAAMIVRRLDRGSLSSRCLGAALGLSAGDVIRLRNRSLAGFSAVQLKAIMVRLNEADSGKGRRSH